MKLLNLGCGGQRIVDEVWTNLDDLHGQLAPGTPARAALDAEPNYTNFEVGYGALPFDYETFDGVLASHFFEHFCAQQGVAIMKECLRILKPGGVLLVSVPDASYFRSVHHEDRNENWPRLFGVTDPANPIPSFRSAALFFEQHKMVFTEDALWCCFEQAGFEQQSREPMDFIRDLQNIPAEQVRQAEHAHLPMVQLLNRLEFSLVMSAIKNDSK